MEEQATPETKAIKVTNPLGVGNFAKMIDELCDKMKVKSITYETLYAYFCQTVQFGGDRAELWVALYGDEPVAFAHWFAKPFPHRGVVCCDFVYSWNRMADPISVLIDKFIEFGTKNNAPYYEGIATNEAVCRVISKAAKKKGIELVRTEWIHLFGRK